MPLEVTGVSIDAGYKHLTLSDGREIVTRTMLAATGMEYREHPAPGVAEHTGAGVYYGAATTEAPAFSGRRVARGRRRELGGTERPCIWRATRRTCRSWCAATPCATPCRSTSSSRSKRRRTSGSEPGRSSNVSKGTATWNASRSRLADGTSQVEDIDAVFVFIGTKPRSDWLPAGVLRDAKGFVLTGQGSASGRRVRAHLEGTPRADAARDQRARRVRGRRHPRRRHEPGGVSRRRRIDGGAVRSRIPGADLNL